ncbi:MAG: hypothetical protein RML94_16370, partial [Bacteroidia bacterium]|nr:hypothetical protein [Bacteroidia bacterium]
LIVSFGFAYQSRVFFERQMQIQLSEAQRYLWLMIGMVSSTGYYFWGMTTPSYNFYALVGILIASTGFLSLWNGNFNKLLSVLLFVLGVHVLYMAKITSALFFIFCVGLCLTLAIKWKLTNLKAWIKPIILIIVLTSATLLTYIWAMYEGVENYLLHVKNAQGLASKLGYSSNIFILAILSSGYKEVTKFYFFIPYITILLYFLFFQTKRKSGNESTFQKVYFYSIFALIILTGFFSHRGISWKWAWGYMAILYAVIPFMLYYVVKIKDKAKNIVLIVLYMLLISFAYVFGTNNSYSIAVAAIYIAAGISLAWVAFALYFYDKKMYILVIAVLLIAIFSLSTIGQFFIHPYRSQYKLHQHTYFLNVLGGVYVDKSHYNYAKELQKIAQENFTTLEKYPYLIDVTGKSASNLILDKPFLGQSWMLWGRSQAEYTFLNEILKQISDDKIRKAALFTNENVPVEKIVTELPMRFPEDYQKIGQVYFDTDKEYHILWVPKSSE